MGEISKTITLGHNDSGPAEIRIRLIGTEHVYMNVGDFGGEGCQVHLSPEQAIAVAKTLLAASELITPLHSSKFVEAWLAAVEGAVT